tara:strand:+ start:225 stop:599 length:375 start_codon:yes stop_codon:yes gene_type:complete
MDSLEYLQIRLEQLSENKIFIGLIMIMVNIGARFIIEEIDDEHKEIIKNPYFRKIFIFCSVFIATRDIGVALIVTIIFAVLMHEVLKTDVKEKETKVLESNKVLSAKKELDNHIEKLKLIKDSL